MTERSSVIGRGSIEHDDASAASPRLAYRADASAAVRADAPNNLRAALRQATSELHGQLDHAPDQRALLAPGLTLERYASIMSKHHRALAIGEAALAALESAWPSGLPPYRPRLPALEADLATLDAAPRSTPSLEPPGPPMAGMEAAQARGRYLGTRYVLEGSTQGAVFIARRLEQHLPDLGARAFDYWRLQAEEAPAWHALTRTLASLPVSGLLGSAAIAAAGDTFAGFLRAFDLDAPAPSHAREPDLAQVGERR